MFVIQLYFNTKKRLKKNLRTHNAQQIFKIQQQISDIQKHNSQIANNYHKLLSQVIQDIKNIEKQLKQIKYIKSKKLQQQNIQLFKEVNKIKESIEFINKDKIALSKRLDICEGDIQKIFLGLELMGQNRSHQIETKINYKQEVKTSYGNQEKLNQLKQLTSIQADRLMQLQVPAADITQKSMSLTYSVSSLSDILNQQTQKSKVGSIKSLKEINVKSSKYIIDNNNFLMDEAGNYILDEQGKQIRLTEAQIEILRQSDVVKYRQN